MRKEFRFERRLLPTRVVKQLQVIRKEVVMLRRGQQQILQILGESELTERAKKSLEGARATPTGKYISHEDIKK